MEKEVRNGILVLKMPETINSGNVAGVQTEALAAIADNSYRVIFDFSINRYISSAGLRMLMEASNSVDINNGKMILAAVSETVKDVLVMTGFDDLFEMVYDISLAEAKF